MKIAAPITDRSLWSIDFARAAAALSVFVYHYGIGGLLAGATHVNAFQYLAWPGANIAVPMFFALSGYCIHGSELGRLEKSGDPTLRFGDLRGYYRRRFLRIYPVYFVTLVFSCLVNALQGEAVDPRDFAAHALLIHGFSAAYFNSINLVLWTISVEACFYLIYPAWLWVRLRVGLAGGMVIGGAVCALSSALTARYFYPYSLPGCWFFLNNWFGWLAGGWLAETMVRDPKLFRRAGWWLAGAAGLAGCVVAHRAGLFMERGRVLDVSARVILCLWPLAGFVLLEPSLRTRATSNSWQGGCIRLVRQIGLASYSLYLLHEPLIALRNHLHRHMVSSVLKSALFVGWFFLILFLCWLSYYFLERFFLRRRSALRVAKHPARLVIDGSGA